jgi:hypothetical protein
MTLRTNGRGGVHGRRILRLEPGYTQILAGNFGGRGDFRDLFCFNTDTGEGAIYFDAGERRRRLRFSMSVLRSIVVRGRFHIRDDATTDDLLFYNAGNGGRGRIYARVGDGFRRVASDTGWEAGWTHVVPGFFFGGAGSASDFFVYRSTNLRSGTGRFYAGTSVPSIRTLGDTMSLERWTHIVSGNFGVGDFSDLFFYNSITAAMRVYRTDERGNLIRRTEYPTHVPHRDFRPTGSRAVVQSKTFLHVVRGKFSDTEYADVLFYKPSDGTVEIFATTGRGLERLPSPPGVVISATPEDIDVGQSSKLRWAFADAASATLTLNAQSTAQKTMEVSSPGELVVTPSLSTRYELKATNADGTSETSVKVDVDRSRLTPAPGYPQVADTTIFLEARPPIEGDLPFVGMFGLFGHTGYVQSLMNPNVFPIQIPVPGGGPEARIVLDPGRATTPDHLQTAFGSPTPSLPRTFTAFVSQGFGFDPQSRNVLLSIRYVVTG